uniref:F-box/kelch-repeat protein At3g06240-like n=1 Tax=Erigeron canadensis TaxID=72917 RepID=UPI001CB8A58F|nr:F-box/kelch-repeat protein At3g06240-like [Erigeron canadensis]
MGKSLKGSPHFDTNILFDLIFMTLVWWPVKCLLQMKSVCSIWRAKISDPLFIKAHLEKTNDLRRLRYIFHDPMKAMMRSIGLKDRDSRYEHTIPITDFSNHVEILGSLNGLLLLGDGECTYHLWNPSTRLLRKFSGPYIFRGQLRNFALGYDATTCAYKVVRIVRVTSIEYRKLKLPYRPCPYQNTYYDATRAHMYNCKTNCWKKIQDFPYVIFKDAQGITMNGYPHWVMLRDRQGRDDVVDFVIVYFDLVEEKFMEIPKPNWLIASSKFKFGVFKGQLCFIRYANPQSEIWVMPKHGESWIDFSSVTNIDSVLRHPGWDFRRVDDAADINKAFVGAHYVESLVSPYGGSDMVG